MQLKPLEAGRYDDEFILVRNPESGKQALFTEAEFEIVRFLKQNEQETLLALLLPNIGIAKKDHINLCLAVIRKLKRLEIVDLADITGKMPTNPTITKSSEIDLTRKKFELGGLSALATAFLAIGERLFGWMGTFLLLFMCLAAAGCSFVFFPFEAVDPLVRAHLGISYWKLFSAIYAGGFLAFNFRAILQAAFLRAEGRPGRRAGFSLYFPFIVLNFDRSDGCIAGKSSRVQMGLLGILSPLAVSVAATGAVLLGNAPADMGYYFFAACVAVAMLMACPFLPFDLADILHVIQKPEDLRDTTSQQLRRILRFKGPMNKAVLVGMGLSFLWLLGWLDSLRGFAEMLSHQLSEDFYFYEDLPRSVGAGATGLTLLSLLFFPLGVFAVSFFKDLRASRRQRVVMAKGKEKVSLSLEEKVAAITKIPLFAYLSELERVLLLNEMQTAFFADGQRLVKQGEVGQEFYVLVKGSANVTFKDPRGGTYFLASIGEGDAFGEIALIDDVPRTASVDSDGGCIVLVLKKEAFDKFVSTLGSSDRVKTLIRLTSFFRRHPLFSKLDVRDLAQLIDTFMFDSMSPGDEIPDGDQMFRVVYSGYVRVDTGEDSADTELYPDDCFGYDSGLQAKFFAAEGVGLLSVRKADFENLIWAKLVERPEVFL